MSRPGDDVCVGRSEMNMCGSILSSSFYPSSILLHVSVFVCSVSQLVDWSGSIFGYDWLQGEERRGKVR